MLGEDARGHIKHNLRRSFTSSYHHCYYYMYDLVTHTSAPQSLMFQGSVITVKL